MSALTSLPLASLTTSRVGGPARRYINAETEDELIGAVRAADEAKEPLLIVGGGSNLLISDAGFDGAVVHVATRGLEFTEDKNTVTVRAQAGHPWDELVAETLRRGCSGLEALSGIPGLAGATPVQNVGAYGADVSHSITGVRAWDRETRTVVQFTNEELQFGYRDSVLKRATVNGSPRYVVLTVDFGLTRGMESAPVRYAELARALGVEAGERAAAEDVRREVLRLRAGKGMVLDPEDPDTWSTGSFFTNPVVSEEEAAHLPPEAPRYPVEQPGMVKLSAAWLIDRSGFPKGFGLPETGQGAELAGGRASLSTKHTLAVTNRGNASAEDLLAVARAVADGVDEAFGLRLHPEPLLINCSL